MHIFLTVKRKISAIFLLLSFLGFLAHDLIPHHHHDSKDGIISVHKHDSEDANSETNPSEENEGCYYSELVNANNHNDCPHHLHQCPTKIFELTNNHSGAKTVKIRVLFNSPSGENNSKPETPDSESKEYFEHKYPLPNFHVIGAKSLRAPPSIV